MKKIIISGQRRSGTTFLSNLLNSQSNCSIYYDTFRSLFTDAKKLRIKDINETLFSFQKNILVSGIEAEALSLGLDIKADRQFLNSWYDIFSYSLMSIGKSDDKMIGLKITSEYFYSIQLLEHGIKFIYLVRDPRDVLLSSKNRFSNYNIQSFIRYWKTGYKKIMNLQNHKNVLMLRYEDLISQNQETINSLNSFLGLNLNTNLQELKARKDSKYIDNSSFGDVKKIFDPAPIYRWKKNLNIPEVKLASLICRKEIAHLNYEQQKVGNFVSIIKYFLAYNLGSIKNFFKVFLSRLLTLLRT